MTRAAIEAVLRKHANKPYEYVVRDVWSYRELRPGLDALLDDLLALVPTPSREGLEELLEHETSIPFQHGLHGYNEARQWIITPKRLIDFIMSWALGQPREQQWCSHCVWDTEGDFATATSPLYHTPHWCFQEPGMKPTPVRETWIACPLCAAPRPR